MSEWDNWRVGKNQIKRKPQKRIKYKIQDAFPVKREAEEHAHVLRLSGKRATIKKVNMDNGRLKYGVYDGGKRKVKLKGTIYTKWIKLR